MRKLSVIIIVSLITLSCNDSTVFDIYKPISKTQWHKDSIINFDFNPIDTISTNSIYINLRNNNDYQYSNLFLIVGIDFPNNFSVIDTLEYEMADVEGKFLGSGFTDLKENKLEYKSNVVFPITGTYNIASGNSYRFIDVIKKIRKISKRKINLDYVEVKNQPTKRYFDIQDTKKKFKLKFTNLNIGLKKSLKKL